MSHQKQKESASVMFAKLDPIHDFRFFHIEVDKDQSSDYDKKDLLSWAEGLNDIWVVSHGWNTAMDTAIGQYTELFKQVDKLLKKKEG
jgi:hypothetical protein